ncbi:hypothetical protein Tco_0997746 [Tanacetum coccineum]
MELNMTQLCDIDPMLDDLKVLARCISLWKSHPVARPNEVWALDMVLQDLHESDDECPIRFSHKIQNCNPVQKYPQEVLLKKTPMTILVKIIKRMMKVITYSMMKLLLILKMLVMKLYYIQTTVLIMKLMMNMIIRTASFHNGPIVDEPTSEDLFDSD